MGIKISGLPAASAANSAMQFEVNNAGTSQRLTLAQMFALSMAAVTVDTPLLNLAQTWNAGAVTFTAWKLDVTYTASAAGSKLLDLQVGGVSKFSIRKDGFVETASGSVGFWSAGAERARISGGGFVVGSQFGLTSFSPASPDVILNRDAANILALRSGSFAQEFRLYDTYTDAANYRRVAFSFASGDFLLSAQSAGTGTAGQGQFILQAVTGKQIRFCIGPTQRWLIDAGGHWIAGADNTNDLGASASGRPRTGYFATSVAVAGNQVLVGRRTGWAAATGTATRTTYDTASVTLAELAERVKALLDDLTTHGLIGA